MPTIKTKKEMNLPELIEWGLKNEITSKEYTCDNKDGYKSVIFDIGGNVHLNRFQTYLADDKYEVEIEEPITMDMEFHTVERFISSYVNKYRYATHNNKSVKDILEDRPPHVEVTHIYAEVNNELVLIWTKEKGLVD